MVCTQLIIWKQLITCPFQLLGHCPSIAIPFCAKSPIKLANFCSQIVIPSTALLERGVVSDFLISKCGLTEKEFTKAFRHYNHLLRITSTQKLEEVMELLNGCGLTTPAQVRTVVLRNPRLFFLKSEQRIKSKLSFLRTVIKEEDISKLVIRDATVLNVGEEKLKSSVSLFLRSGFDGKTFSHLVARGPRLLKISEEKLMDLFKQVENLGFKKGSNSFGTALCAISGLTKEALERKSQCLRCLGFSEKQISRLYCLEPRILSLSVEKLKRNGDFIANSVGFPLDDLVKYPCLFQYSLEKRIIPRYNVMEALKSMQVLKREIGLPTFFLSSEKKFLYKYVISHSESSFLMDIYHGRKGGDTQ